MTENLTQKKRDPFWDIMKGFAIILVFWGHSIEWGGGSYFYSKGLYYDNYVFKFIYSFHMPLFMMVSGILFGYSIDKYKSKELAVRKLHSILIPILSFSIIQIILRTLFRHYDLSFVNILDTIISTLWYLWAYLYSCLVTIIIWRLGGANCWIGYATICILSLLLPNEANIRAFSFLYPFFIMGFYLCRYRKIEKLLEFGPLSICLIGITFFSLLLFYDKDCYFYISQTSLLPHLIQNDFLGAMHQVVVDFYRILVGFFGVIFFIALLHKVSRKGSLYDSRIGRWICCLGTYSMGLYCFQDLLWTYYYLAFNSFCSDTIISNLVSFLLVLGLSLSFSIITKNNVVLRCLFMGGR